MEETKTTNTNITEANTTKEIDSVKEAVVTPAKTVAGVDVTTYNSDGTSIEDNLELKRMGFKKRLQTKVERFKENTQDMSTWGKIKYFVYYYKWHVILTALAIFLIITVPSTIIKNNRPVSISYAVVNSPAPEQINEKLFNEYAEHYNLVKGYQIRNNLYVSLSQKGYEENLAKSEGNSSYTQFPTLCYNDYYDIILTDRSGLEYCTSTSLVQPLEDRLYDDILSELKEKYPDIITTSPNYDGKQVEFALDVSDTKFIKELNVGYDKVYICFPGGSEQNIINIRRFLKYIFDLDIEI
ncbi:MAG: hypothetical protein E7257_10420 [Lachnospiraceae bacterium]|nr:hypothetical protein [Lachnospiraceae bacterium]